MTSLIMLLRAIFMVFAFIWLAIGVALYGVAQKLALPCAMDSDDEEGSRRAIAVSLWPFFLVRMLWELAQRALKVRTA